MNAHFQRGWLLYSQGRYADAVGELRMQLLEEEDYLTHGILALALVELEKFDEASEHAHRAIGLAPDEGHGHYALCRVLMARRRYPEAKQAILEAIRLSPDEADYFGVLASCELQASRWREALEAANQGLAIDPENGLCTNLRAQALVQLGDRQAAAATIGEALARRPDDSYTHANQGWALLHADKPREAAEHFREALRLDPEMEWARAGIVEALKARNFLYRWMLAWFLWMSRLSPGARWGLVFGGYFGARFIRHLAAESPNLAPLLWPILYAYMVFVLLTWLSPSLFNLLLRFDRFGRHALSTDQVRGANLLAACLLVALLSLVGYLITGYEVLILMTIFTGILSLPASAIYICHAGWPRRVMAAISLTLLVAIAFVIGVLALPVEALSMPLLQTVTQVVKVLPLALLASQFVAIYLMQVRPQR